mgnify:CR=1 FL=1
MCSVCFGSALITQAPRLQTTIRTHHESKAFDCMTPTRKAGITRSTNLLFLSCSWISHMRALNATHNSIRSQKNVMPGAAAGQPSPVSLPSPNVPFVPFPINNDEEPARLSRLEFSTQVLHKGSEEAHDRCGRVTTCPVLSPMRAVAPCQHGYLCMKHGDVATARARTAAPGDMEASCSHHPAST